MPLTFGVEIEFLAPSTMDTARAAQALATATALGVRAANRNAPTTGNWKVVHDGSVAGTGRVGMEAVSPVLTEDNIGQIDQVCAALSQMGCVVNRSCGLHVHIGAQSFPLDAVKRLVILYAESEQYIDMLLPPSRRANNNSYVRSVKSNLRLQSVLDATDVAGVSRGVNSGERYVKLNLTSYWRHGTIEFRHHSGTIDPEKIRNWVRFCSHMVTTSLRETGPLAAIPTPPTLPSVPAGSSSMNDGLARLARLPRNSYWLSGRQTRTAYRLLTRVEGATSEELRVALEIRTRPNLRILLDRAGVEANGWSAPRNQRRGGHQVYLLPSEEPQHTSGLPGLSDLPSNSYWRSSGRTRVLYGMLTRPQGTTIAEVAETAAFNGAAPDLNWHVARAGSSEGVLRRMEGQTRGGFPVYQLTRTSEGVTLGDILQTALRQEPTVPTVPVIPQTINSLEALLERLQVPATERTYWVERAALLSEPLA